MNRHLSAEFWLGLNTIWVATITHMAKLSSKTVISKKKTRDALKAIQKQLKRHGLETDQTPQRLLWTTKLRFFLTKSCLD